MTGWCPRFGKLLPKSGSESRLSSILLYYSGYNEGGYIPEGLNLLPVSVPVGSQMIHAAGIGYAMKYRGKNSVAATFFGDGATSQGDFHEALNFASVYQVPVIFICQNNHWAISLPRSRQSHSKTLAQKAIAYDMPGIQVDGNDVLAVYKAAKDAVDRARSGGGPTLIEMVTYRLSMHTTADDPKKYRTEEEVAEWEKRDPISRFEKYLRDKHILDDLKVQSVTEEVKTEIGAAERRWSELVEKGSQPPGHVRAYLCGTYPDAALPEGNAQRGTGTIARLGREAERPHGSSPERFFPGRGDSTDAQDEHG